MVPETDSPHSPPQIFSEGSAVGRYRILRRIGSGAMGDVFLAEDPTIERTVAIKAVRLEARRQQDVEERRGRMMMEAKAAGRLNHTHIVTLFDVGEQGGVMYLALEFVGGKDLACRLEEGPPLTLRAALEVIRQTAEGLAFAHARGILHRDIKPSNLLLDNDDGVKISDFGIAKVMGEASELTTTGMLVGSPQYLSPEQVQGEELDGRTDVFSLGVVAYELLAGVRPFQGDVLSTLIYQILHREPAPLRTSWPAAPVALEKLLQRMLEKAPEERIEASAVAAEMASILQMLPDEILDRPLERSLPTDGIPTQAVDSTGLRRRRERPWKLFAAVGAGVVLVAIALWLALGRGGDGTKGLPAGGSGSGGGSGAVEGTLLPGVREVGPEVYFLVEPEDARVFIDETFIGRASGLRDPRNPYRIEATGEMRVRVLAPGRAPVELRLRVRPEIDGVLPVEVAVP